MDNDPEYKPKWVNRRRVIFGSLIVDCLFIIAILAGWFIGLEVNTPITVIASALIAKDLAIIASYVFGAAWDDLNFKDVFRP